MRTNYSVFNNTRISRHTFFVRTTFVFARVSNEGKLGLVAKAGRWCAGRGWILDKPNGWVVGGGAPNIEGSFGLEGRDVDSEFASRLVIT